MPLGISNWTDEQNVVFFRGNLENGLLEFKAVKANPSSFWPWNLSSPVIPATVLDESEQWKKMQELLAK